MKRLCILAMSGVLIGGCGGVRIKRVVSGDILLTSSGARVRLAGLQTFAPDAGSKGARTLGKRARSFTETFVRRGVRIEYVPNLKDKRGVPLVYVRARGACLNEGLLREGLARVALWQEHPERKAYARLEQMAVDAERGIWKSKNARFGRSVGKGSKKIIDGYK